MLREERNLKNWKLIYDAPAEIWEEALPLGNGSLGAMTYGRIQEDRINLNLDTLWSGFGREKGNTKGIADWKLIRELLKEKQEKAREQKKADEKKTEKKEAEEKREQQVKPSKDKVVVVA